MCTNGIYSIQSVIKVVCAFVYVQYRASFELLGIDLLVQSIHILLNIK